MTSAPYCGGMLPEMSGLPEGDHENPGRRASLDSVEAGLGRLQQQLAQLDRELRQTRADYRRFVELTEGHVRSRLPQLNALGRLTSQERRVATLAACGHSNLEVAARLHVTVHTVKSQMGSILRKLDLRSRWELDHLLRSEDGRAGRPAQTR